jgi:hypothetical protein
VKEVEYRSKSCRSKCGNDQDTRARVLGQQTNERSEAGKIYQAKEFLPI